MRIENLDFLPDVLPIDKPTNASIDDDDRDDSDFIEVPETSQLLPKTSQLLPEKPKGASHQISSQNGAPSQKPTAPILSFGIDLSHWSTGGAPPLAELRHGIGGASADEHRFWRPSSPSLNSDGDAARLEAHAALYRERIIDFSEPVTAQELRRCNAPLPKSGGLCPRMDKERCPFHGVIVERGTGEPVGVASSEGEQTIRTGNGKKNQ